MVCYVDATKCRRGLNVTYSFYSICSINFLWKMHATHLHILVFQLSTRTSSFVFQEKIKSVEETIFRQLVKKSRKLGHVFYWHTFLDKGGAGLRIHLEIKLQFFEKPKSAFSYKTRGPSAMNVIILKSNYTISINKH